jgi:hypothetical protein
MSECFYAVLLMGSLSSQALRTTQSRANSFSPFPVRFELL